MLRVAPGFVPEDALSMSRSRYVQASTHALSLRPKEIMLTTFLLLSAPGSDMIVLVSGICNRQNTVPTKKRHGDRASSSTSAPQVTRQ